MIKTLLAVVGTIEVAEMTKDFVNKRRKRNESLLYNKEKLLKDMIEITNKNKHVEVNNMLKKLSQINTDEINKNIIILEEFKELRDITNDPDLDFIEVLNDDLEEFREIENIIMGENDITSFPELLKEKEYIDKKILVVGDFFKYYDDKDILLLKNIDRNILSCKMDKDILDLKDIKEGEVVMVEGIYKGLVDNIFNGKSVIIEAQNFVSGTDVFDNIKQKQASNTTKGV